MQHLENMQHLREGIHWRSRSAHPLVEYRSESQKLFDSLQATLTEEVLRAIFHARKNDAVVKESTDETYDSELTKLAKHSSSRVSTKSLAVQKPATKISKSRRPTACPKPTSVKRPSAKPRKSNAKTAKKVAR